MIEEVVAQKVTSAQRCVARARGLLAEAGPNFRTDYTRQDAAVLNAIRACDTAIDLANMLIRRKRLGIPSESKESFSILKREKLIEPALADRLGKMVGFRNIAVHQYHELDLAIVESVIGKDLDDLLAFAQVVRSQLDADG